MAKLVLGLMAVALAGLFASCAGSPGTVAQARPAAPAPLTVTDQLGRSVTIKSPPQRIVSIAPSNTEILYALGLADRLVAVTDYDNYPPEVKEKPSIGGFATPNIEQVVAMAPDLVLATSIHQAKVIPQLEARGVTVLALNPKTIDQVFAAIELVGQATGVAKTAAALTASMRQRVAAVTDKTGGLAADRKPRLYYIVWQDPLMIVGTGTLHDELIGLAGGVNLGHDLTGYADISLENVVMADPQVLIAGVGMGSGEDQAFQFIRTEPRLADTQARKNNRVYAINTDLIGRPGPRIVDALEQFAVFIHPELFKEQP